MESLVSCLHISRTTQRQITCCLEHVSRKKKEFSHNRQGSRIASFSLRLSRPPLFSTCCTTQGERLAGKRASREIATANDGRHVSLVRGAWWPQRRQHGRASRGISGRGTYERSSRRRSVTWTGKHGGSTCIIFGSGCRFDHLQSARRRRHATRCVKVRYM